MEPPLLTLLVQFILLAKPTLLEAAESEKLSSRNQELKVVTLLEEVELDSDFIDFILS